MTSNYFRPLRYFVISSLNEIIVENQQSIHSFLVSLSQIRAAKLLQKSYAIFSKPSIWPMNRKQPEPIYNPVIVYQNIF